MPRLLRIDAFTSKPFRGNPAAVVPDAGGLDEKQMQTIAQEMNISETAFLLPSDQADFRLRWFTPKAELVFCGHGTIATAHALFEEGRFGTGRFAAPGLVFE